MGGNMSKVCPWQRLGPILVLFAAIVLRLDAQVAAPPTVNLEGRTNQPTSATAPATAITTPTPVPPPPLDLPGAPNVPEISQLDQVFKDKSIGQKGDELRRHVEWRSLQNRVNNDPDIVAARTAAENARTDFEKRERLRKYYNLYYGRMSAIATTPEVKATVEAQKLQHLNQTKQPKVRHETDAPPPTPTPPPGTTPTPTPKPKHKPKKKKESSFHGLLKPQ